VFSSDAAHGKLREPLLRVSGLLRAFLPPPPLAPDPRYFVDLSGTMTYQSPLKSGTVFNFFQPGYVPPGRFAAAGLFAPEFQITQETTVISFTNFDNSIIVNGIGTRERDANDNGVSVRLNLDPYIALLERADHTDEENQTALIDSLNTLFSAARCLRV
jgi:hypothetical protein